MLKRAKLTKAELADLLGLSTKTINGWGNGFEFPKYLAPLLEALAKVSKYELMLGLRSPKIPTKKRSNQMTRAEKTRYLMLKDKINAAAKARIHDPLEFSCNGEYYTMELSFANSQFHINIAKNDYEDEDNPSKPIFSQGFFYETEGLSDKEIDDSLIAIINDVLDTLDLEL